ncbi:MAG TPA: hypothetical protein VG795_10630 [Acidimicrobiia bacterium]|nr:hypothetical protein [Acidimicrobiia bacterium]
MGAFVSTRFNRLPHLAAAIGLLLVVMPAVTGEREALAAPPTVNCDTEADIFNTGYDAATGTFLSHGSTDANWEAAGRFDRPSPSSQTSLPPSNATWVSATVGNLASGYWTPSPYGNAQWISKETPDAPESATGDWYYRYRFTLDPAVDPARFALSMNFFADNTVAEVFINDVAQSPLVEEGLPQTGGDPYVYDGYRLDKAAETVLNHNWRTGENTIIVQIKSGAPKEGFLAQIRPSTLCPRPAIKLQKSVTPTNVLSVGGKARYSFVVTNIGNEPLTGVSVTENAFSGKGAAPTVSCPGSALATEEAMTCTAEYTVTQADYDAAKATGFFKITNTATATGTPLSGSAVTSQPATATFHVNNASVLIVKATTKPFVTEVGEQVPYTFTVKNTSVLLAASNLSVTDPKIGNVTCPINRLGNGKTMECTGTYTVTQADLDAGRIVNTATVTGTLGTKPVTEVSNEVVVPAIYDPALSVVKASTTTSFNTVGQLIPYTFTVTNVGNVTLHDVGLNDSKVTDPGCPVSELRPGEVTVCSGTYRVTQQDLNAGSIANQATAAGKTPANIDVVAKSNLHVISAIASPQIAIVKSTKATHYAKAGEAITYTFTVTNTGNQDVSDIKVTDPLLGGTVCTLETLTPGTQDSCSKSRTTTAADLDAGRISNVAAAAGTSPAETAVIADSNRIVVPAVYSPQLAMVKSSTSAALEGVGTKIPYEFTVINTGNVTVENVKITDARVSDLSCPQTRLALGERMTCTANYTVTQADLDAGQVVNQATVGGDVPASGKKLDPTPSNEVIVRTAAANPDVQGAVTQPGGTGVAPAPEGQLPRTGGNVTTELRTALALVLIGLAFLAAGRLSGPVWRAAPGRSRGCGPG